MVELDFTEVEGKGFVSDAIELEASTFALHLEFSGNRNNITILRSITGSNFIVAKEMPYFGQVVDVTFTDALAGMSIKVICDNEPIVGKIL